MRALPFDALPNLSLNPDASPGALDWDEHQWDSLKLLVLLLVFVGLVLSEYAFVSTHFAGAVEWANHVLPFGARASQPGGGGAG